MAIEAIGGATGAASYSAKPEPQVNVQQATRTVENAQPKTGETPKAQAPEQNPTAFQVTDNGEQQQTQTDPTEALKKAVEEINKSAKNSVAQFSVHEDTNRIMVKIVDKETKEVIKELPAEKTLDLIAKAWEMAGLAVDERR